LKVLISPADPASCRTPIKLVLSTAFDGVTIVYPGIFINKSPEAHTQEVPLFSIALPIKVPVSIVLPAKYLFTSELLPSLFITT